MPKPSIPAGLRDVLPAEAAELRRIERDLLGAFASFGYAEVIPPTFEYHDSLAVEAGETIRREMIRLFDQDGSLLSLRPELTTPTARLAAQRLSSGSVPLRLCYSQTVFRQEPPQKGRERESRQTGAELFGVSGAEGDAESLSLLCESLSATGLSDFQVGVSHSAFVSGLIAEATADTDLRARIVDALQRRDQVAVTGLCRDLGALGETIIELPSLRGPGALERAEALVSNADSKQALSEIKGILALASAYSEQYDVVPDLGLVCGLDYYTGAIFEAYAPGVGTPISSGGRYDGLTAEFGWPQPATGFQHNLESLHIALAYAGVELDSRLSTVALTYSGEANAELALRVARKLRGRGLDVALDRASAAPDSATASVQVSDGRLTVAADGETRIIEWTGEIDELAAILIRAVDADGSDS